MAPSKSASLWPPPGSLCRAQGLTLTDCVDCYKLVIALTVSLQNKRVQEHKEIQVAPAAVNLTLTFISWWNCHTYLHASCSNQQKLEQWDAEWHDVNLTYMCSLPPSIPVCLPCSHKILHNKKLFFKKSEIIAIIACWRRRILQCTDFQWGLHQITVCHRLFTLLFRKNCDKNEGSLFFHF